MTTKREKEKRTRGREGRMCDELKKMGTANESVCYLLTTLKI